MKSDIQRAGVGSPSDTVLEFSLPHKASKSYILGLCRLPHLTMEQGTYICSLLWSHKMKTPHASCEILEMNYKSPPSLT